MGGGEDLVEAVETDLRPGFHRVAPGAELVAVEELQIGDHRLAFLHIVALEPEDVDHSEMYAADVV